MSMRARIPMLPRRMRLLPLFMVVAGVALVVKAGSFASDLTHFMSVASAQEQAEAAGAEAQGDTDADTGDDASQASDGEAPASEQETREALGGVSAAERNLLEDLRRRREELEKREREAALREQILASTEQRIDKKIEQLKTLEARIEKLVDKHEAREDEKLESIVQVYETMKPKDAAPVFERLELAIQMQVATRMKNRSMAALLSEMNPEAAKKLTTRLAIRDELPEAAELLDEETSKATGGS